MIDTVRLAGDYFISDCYLYDKELFPKNYIVRRNNDDIDEEAFVYHKKGDPVKLEYYAQTKKLYVEVSIPKLLFGNNVKMVSDSDIQRFYIKLDNLLRNKFHAETHSDFRPYYWKVQRMDVCWNFEVGGAVKNYINAFRQIHIPKYVTHTYGDNETVQWQCSTKLMKFYDKEAEVKAHKGSNDVIEMAQGILRFEAEIRSNSGQMLNKLSEFRWAGELLSETVAKNLLLYHLKKLKLDRQLTISNKLDILRKLIEVYGYGKAQDLVGFIECINLLGKESVNEPSKSTYDRKMKDLATIGFAPIFSEVKLPPLDLDSIVA